MDFRCNTHPDILHRETAVVVRPEQRATRSIKRWKARNVATWHCRVFLPCREIQLNALTRHELSIDVRHWARPFEISDWQGRLETYTKKPRVYPLLLNYVDVALQECHPSYTQAAGCCLCTLSSQARTLHYKIGISSRIHLCDLFLSQHSLS